MRIDELTDDVLEHIVHIVCKLFNPFVSGLGAAGIGSTSKPLRVRLQVNALPWLRSQHAAAVALAGKLGMTCDELCEALTVRGNAMKVLNADDMQMLGRCHESVP